MPGFHRNLSSPSYVYQQFADSPSSSDISLRFSNTLSTEWILLVDFNFKALLDELDVFGRICAEFFGRRDIVEKTVGWM